jgi:S1-C subfamily serine protease
MKKSTIAFVVAIACFAGVLGALRVDRYLQSRSDRSPVEFSSTVKTMPIAYEQTSAPPDFRAAAKKVNPSVVSVDPYQRVRRGFFDEEGTIAKTGTGSGVIVSADGVIVTNNHVVADPMGRPVQEVKVRLSDKRTITAKVLGTDPRSDLAVLKIEASNLIPVEMGTSEGVEVGQWVIAVGNPLGFDNTVSVGVVSSLARDLPVGVSGLVNAIQTDAAINPGNSGGALTDAQGRLIGINSAIASSTGGSVGIGFAIPVDRVKVVVSDIVKLGYARYAGLGVSYNGRLDGALGDPQIRAQLAELTGGKEPPRSGIIVSSVAPESAAAKVGIGQYDVLLSVDDTPLESSFSLNKVLSAKKPGEKALVKYWSKGETKTATVTLQEINSR